MPLQMAVLLSGSGSTLQNFIDRIAARELDAEIVCVVSSRESAYGLERAREHGIPAAVYPRARFSDAAAMSAAIWRAVDSHDVGLVALAGFMSLLTVPAAYENRIMNVHPALIPSFCGKGMYGHHVHQAVLDYGAKLSGATVHFVDSKYDNGPIILQESVPVLEDDTADTLATRVQACERSIYPRAVQLFAEGRLEVKGRRVRILEEGE